MRLIKIVSLLIIITSLGFFATEAQTYKIVDTGQKKFYDNVDGINSPEKGEAFYGEDAQFKGNQPSYKDNGDGTITDNVTGLMWQKSPDRNGDGKINAEDKLTFEEAAADAKTCKTGGYHDWRLPTIKELFSLITYEGIDPSGYDGDAGKLRPFIDTAYFDFGYGDESAGERIIDAQFATSTKYVSTTMRNNKTMFGVNFADGRIKGYPISRTPRGYKKFYVIYVRGNKKYGVNDFKDNGDGTVTDEATGLMWPKDDSKKGMNWEQALAWVQKLNKEDYLGYNDWRLPNVKELQSIVDYSRSPETTNSAAINPVFNCTPITDEGGQKDYPFYWSSTTHANMMNGRFAAYVAFGRALGWMHDPFGRYDLMDVHGAGAQRSDPKTGDPADFPHGHGPQGDVIRIYNFVRPVRTADAKTTSSSEEDKLQNSGNNTESSKNISE